MRKVIAVGVVGVVLGGWVATARAQDTTSLLSTFLVGLRNGTIGNATLNLTYQAADGTAAAPSLTFASQTTTGAFYTTNAFNVGIQGNSYFQVGGTNVVVQNGAGLGFSAGTGAPDLILVRDAANALALKNGANAQAFNIYNTYTSATNYEQAQLAWQGNRFQIWTNKGSGGGSARGMDLVSLSDVSIYANGSAAVNKILNVSTGGVIFPNDNTYDIGVSGATRPRSEYLAAPAITVPTQAAGGTLNNSGDLTRLRYQITVAPATGDCSTAFIAAALTADCTIATLPAGVKLAAVYADVTAGLTCSGTCTGTKTIGAGKTAGGVEILAAGLNVAATGQFGLADADLGSGMTRAAAIQGGYIGSWTATTPVIVRFTSGTGNWGDGGATFVNAGSVKFTLVTEQIK